VKILFLVPHPLQKSPSQRFRFEQYFAKLDEKGIQYRVQSFLSENNWQVFFESGNVVPKALALINGFAKRIWICFSMIKFDFVFVHREAAPAGPPIFEWFAARLLKRKLIFDFDDAIWTTDADNQSPFTRFIKWRSKVPRVCSWSYKVSCGNQYLVDFAKQFNSHVVLNPTTIDTARVPKQSPIRGDQTVTIGWTGSHSTLKYLTFLEPVLQRLEKEFASVQVIIIANRKPDLALSSMRFIPWSLENEIRDIGLFDIGLMPLPDDEWSKGKCGFKVLQYMSMSIPAVASPVGVNMQLIDHEYSGLLARSESEWYEALKKLIMDKTLRTSIGKRGRDIVETQFSVRSNSDNFLRLFA
jgi:glycosyltransferase involved in cell wall biosynthesis